MIYRIKHAIVVLLVLGNFSLASAVPPDVTRFTLSNGIKVVSLYVEDSTDVVILSYLPLGLANDGKAKAQWSHLIEHLTIRTTGPIDFKTSSAETMTDNMRLEFIGNTDNWMQGLERHAKWLSGLPFSEKSLAEELPSALSEIDITEARLATHKSAFAAWNQVFRHGETDIAMRGNVQSAKLNELQEYRDLHLVQADRVLLCVIGGVEAETLQPVMEKQLGSINLTAKKLPAATATLEAAKDQIATWDVNVTHYVETYAIPRPENEDYPALYIANALLGLGLMQDIQLKELTGFVLCGVDLVTPEQTYLQISASLKPDTDVEKVKQRIRQLVNRLKQPENNVQVVMAAQTFSMQFSSPVDVEMVMQRIPADTSTSMVLGNIGVRWGMLEYQYGDTLPQLAKAFANVSAADVANVVKRYLTEDERMTLVLTPRDAFLDEFGEVNEIDIKQPEPPPIESMPEVSEADVTKAKRILAAAVDAHGGLEKLQAVKNIVMEGHTSANSPTGPQIEGTSYYVYPDKFRQDLKMPQGETAYVFDGTSGFVLMPMGVQPIPLQMANTFKDAVFREPLWLLTNLSQNDIPIQYAGTEDVQGKPTSILLLRQPSGEMMKLFVSEDTYYIVKIAYPDSSQGITVNRETLLNDYRDVDGVKVAYHAVQNVEGQLFSESRVTRITLNAELEESLFQEPK
ncbi:MAG: insulinase family protein [Candidatus Poribacteria bacterium]|nr:insulinase family protein [Candidatus Poribacteria bacterium]